MNLPNIVDFDGYLSSDATKMDLRKIYKSHFRVQEAEMLAARHLTQITSKLSLRQSQVRPYHTHPSPYYPKLNRHALPYDPQEPRNILAPEQNYIQRQPQVNDTIVVAMSSGVDSSVCAALYSKYPNVRGVYMSNWSQTATCTERDWKDVKQICQQLGIPHERVNFESDYWDNVFSPMIDKYRLGLTPNPDVGCNKYVKFGKLAQYFNDKYGENWWLVTGHYARIMQSSSSGEFHLLRGLSTRKDQSYYLSSIPANVLHRVIFPLGHYLKSETRQMATQFGLHVKNKPDSQGLCFVNPQQSNFRDFLNEYIEPNPGDIVTEDGKIWGHHQGLWHATIGQKSSVSMPQGDPNYKGVWFVADKDVEKNQLIIVRGHDNPKLYKSRVIVSDVDWVYDREKAVGLDPSMVEFQHHSLSTPTRIKSWNITDGNVVELELADSVRALAPGQAGVFYHGNQVLGGGVISKTET
ncbi:hypothetical protein CANMA_002957 [Candida margitis]|uniref:uncharacterized protein n=1 Tax=Candida margitis TaxID=1775924 RepID=UPI002226AFFF|nr:uncharacterized protein CANMA_002957 [Candida margitis]KAI5967523.1 hypothetical protein CANMA_002957 [Candida margitis]